MCCTASIPTLFCSAGSSTAWCRWQSAYFARLAGLSFWCPIGSTCLTGVENVIPQQRLILGTSFRAKFQVFHVEQGILQAFGKAPCHRRLGCSSVHLLRGRPYDGRVRTRTRPCLTLHIRLLTGHALQLINSRPRFFFPFTFSKFFFRCLAPRRRMPGALRAGGRSLLGGAPAFGTVSNGGLFRRAKCYKNLHFPHHIFKNSYGKCRKRKPLLGERGSPAERVFLGSGVRRRSRRPL